MIDTEVSRTFDRRSALFLTAGAVLTSALVTVYSVTTMKALWRILN